MFLKICFAARVPVHIQGSPGKGKTEIVVQVSKELKVGFSGQRAPLLDIVDCRGLPTPPKAGKAATTQWARPAWLPSQGKGILFIDEITAAVRSVQATLYECFETRQDGIRSLAGHEIPADWIPFSAGNLQSDKAVSFGMSSALISRQAIIQISDDHKGWIDWASGRNVGSSWVPKVPEKTPKIITEIIAFIRFKAGALNTFKSDCADKPYACQRTWELLSKVLNVLFENKDDIGEDNYRELLKVACDSLIGEGTRLDFMAFLDCYKDLPTREEIEKSPSTAKLPDLNKSVGAVFAVTGMMIKHANKKNFGAFLEYVERFKRKEFEVMFVQDCVISNVSEFTNTKAFEKWRVANHNLITQND